MAESKLLHVMRNISYTFMSNVIHLLISTVTVLIIPKFVGVETYGYYQLYLFYISYAGVAYFGWCEGIYLREGGKYYSELDKGQYSAQFRLLGLLGREPDAVFPWSCVRRFGEDVILVDGRRRRQEAP